MITEHQASVVASLASGSSQSAMVLTPKRKKALSSAIVCPRHFTIAMVNLIIAHVSNSGKVWIDLIPLDVSSDGAH